MSETQSEGWMIARRVPNARKLSEPALLPCFAGFPHAL
jgi:hypothetical protein